jgi:hypothetical protein
MHRLPGLIKGVLLELLDRPMNRHDIRQYLQRMSISDSAGGKADRAQLNLERDLLTAKKLDIIEERGGRYHLTPGGREVAEHMNEMIPLFMEWALSPETASFLTIWFHGVFSVLKGAIELVREHFKTTGEPADVKHFLGRAMEGRKEKIVLNWLRGQPWGTSTHGVLICIST